MRNLPVPGPVVTGDLLSHCFSQFSALVAASRAEKHDELNLLMPSIALAYAHYLDVIPKHCVPMPMGLAKPSDEQRLAGCYESGTGIDREIVKAVESVGSGDCPYCGMRLSVKPFDRANDRDHFLPVSRFPEFSVLSVNLVVSCDDCNDAKLARFADSLGRLTLLHPYFHPLLGRALLTAEVAVKSGTLQVAFELERQNLTKGEFEIVLGHVRGLDVLTRLSDYASECLFHQLAPLALVGTPIAQVRAALRSLATRDLRDSPNHPLGVATLSVAQSDDLEEILECLVDSHS